MERHETLSGLKAGIHPCAFEQRLGSMAGEVMSLLDYLLRRSQDIIPDKLQSMVATMLLRCSDSRQR